MSILENDNNLKFKPFIKKLFNDVKLIIFYGLILLSITWGLLSLVDLLKV